ncbi:MULTISPECIES: DUF3017 domain-containing protein [unclassified Luteococcus]|uniref:DUF3017 domain-containing protein n=1 Tax=unclassified Luteococcus TaxID=2639923 RepID=UPI00313F32E6
MGASTEQHERDTALARARALASGRTLNQWPLTAVLICLACSLGITATGHWRRGAFAIGCSVLLAGLLRMLLPNRVAGLLVVRRRWFDVLLLLTVGGAIIGLTLVVPPFKPGLGGA